MAADLIPDDVRQFIIDNIDSVAELEGLLLLRSDADAEWEVQVVAERLFITEEQAVLVLAVLGGRNLLAADESDMRKFRYRPATNELRGMVDKVAEVYSKYLVPVTNLIHTKPQSKVQQFADAFMLRKRKD